MGGALVVDGVGAACEDYALIACGAYLLQGGVKAPDLGIDAVVPDAAGDKLVILSSEIEDQDLFVSHRHFPLQKDKQRRFPWRCFYYSISFAGLQGDCVN